MRNWTFKDAMMAIVSNEKESIQELGSKYPLFSVALARIVDEPVVELLSFIPEYVTAQKMEKYLRGELTGVFDKAEVTIEEGETVDAPKASKRGKKAEKPAPIPEPIEEDTEDTAEKEVDYSSMTAPQLYKLCKERGIEVAPKQKQAVYIKALEEADQGQEEDTDEEEDWGEEEDEETVEEPVKASKKTPAKKTAGTGKKASKKAPEPQEDEDWEF